MARCPDTAVSHSLKIGKLEMIDHKLMGVVSLASITISAIGTGLWMLITHFSDIISFAKKLLGGGP